MRKMRYDDLRPMDRVIIAGGFRPVGLTHFYAELRPGMQGNEIAPIALDDVPRLWFERARKEQARK